MKNVEESKRTAYVAHEGFDITLNLLVQIPDYFL
jgi:hypothetical protein